MVIVETLFRDLDRRDAHWNFVERTFALPVQPYAGTAPRFDALGACRPWGVESENWPRRGQFLPDSKPHSHAMGQDDGDKWTAAANLQPTIPKSDGLSARAFRER